MSDLISKKPHCSEEQQGFFGSRAEDGTRTRDPNLGKVMLYQLSYFRMVCFSFAIAKVEQISELPNFLPNFFLTFFS